MSEDNAPPHSREAIQNGNFDDGDAHWSGNDVEASYRETDYFHNGSQNREAELDGHSGQTTVMEQSFAVGGPARTTLNFDAGLRTESNPNVGQEGFEVEILDDAGRVIASMTVYPTTNDWQHYKLDVSFPAAGTYTLRMTELGPDDSLGAIVDNISLLVCFAAATRIRAPGGWVRAGDVRPGDLVATDGGLRPVRWVGRRRLSAEETAADPRLRPVRIAAGALGHGLPLADLRVSRQHRMLVRSPIARRMFGADEVLVAAHRLTALPGIAVEAEPGAMDYVHILLDRHEILCAEGAPSESMLRGAQTRAALPDRANAEIDAIVPRNTAPMRPARLIPTGAGQACLAARLARNARPVLETEREAGPLDLAG